MVEAIRGWAQWYSRDSKADVYGASLGSLNRRFFVSGRSLLGGGQDFRPGERVRVASGAPPGNGDDKGLTFFSNPE